VTPTLPAGRIVSVTLVVAPATTVTTTGSAIQFETVDAMTELHATEYASPENVFEPGDTPGMVSVVLPPGVTVKFIENATVPAATIFMHFTSEGTVITANCTVPRLSDCISTVDAVPQPAPARTTTNPIAHAADARRM
jgi:hypothetical protein